ncbi:MAG: sugar phosphate nucleotidyltransferase [Desulfobacterales bacterium]|nr:sugar phosphate nucleotidyltransferase [Desulfobacterales bacterium]MDX2510446.1 sugar phosphate nucleotidyltransferase [Desulfobacterales bacterium]
MNIAIVLCAGFATRMYPLTKAFPKPLLEVAGRPVLNYLMDQLVELPGLEAIYLVSNGRYSPHFAEWKRLWEHNHRSCCPVVVLINDGAMDNDHRLGASADFQLVMKTIPEPTRVIVTAGDNIYRFGIKHLWEQFLQSDRHYIVALPETDRKKLSKSGVLELATDDRVTRLFEKPAHPSSEWFCPPLYFFQSTVSRHLDEFLEHHAASDAPGYFIDFLCRKDSVFAFRLKASRLDIGSIESYRAADHYLRNNPLKKQ